MKLRSRRRRAAAMCIWVLVALSVLAMLYAANCYGLWWAIRHSSADSVVGYIGQNTTGAIDMLYDVYIRGIYTTAITLIVIGYPVLRWLEKLERSH